jgi:upstream activation factor subunit UAF30
LLRAARGYAAPLPAALREGPALPPVQAAGALAKPVQPDEVLAAVVGSHPLPRTELTKRVWEYIREHKLQDAQD